MRLRPGTISPLWSSGRNIALRVSKGPGAARRSCARRAGRGSGGPAERCSSKRPSCQWGFTAASFCSDIMSGSALAHLVVSSVSRRPSLAGPGHHQATGRIVQAPTARAPLSKLDSHDPSKTDGQSRWPGKGEATWGSRGSVVRPPVGRRSNQEPQPAVTALGGTLPHHFDAE